MRKFHRSMQAQLPAGSVVDCGYYYLDENGKKKPFVGKDGRPFLGLLDGNGRPLPEGRGLHILRFTL